MNWQSVSFDWNQARAFLVTAEEGSLSAAARALGLTQPTLSRQVASLEEELGVALFERVGRSMVLTPAGSEVLAPLRAMGEAAGQVLLFATGQSQSVAGQVAITASDAMAAYVLPGLIKPLRGIAPELECEIVASNEIQDLRRREADIAIRHARPEHPDLVARLIREATSHLYAASSYLDALGRPGRAEDLTRAVYIGVGNSERALEALQGLGIVLTKSQVAYTSNSGVVGWEMVRQGLGMTLMADDVAARTPEVEPVLPELGPLHFPIWLVTHRELHSSRRIRLVFDFLADALVQPPCTQ